MKVVFLKIPKYTIIFGLLLWKKCDLEIQKIAQSGHTDRGT